ncbi:hypothetical protein QE422_002784 [Chryseobacterium sp. SORGH_AS 447]|uniref:hypothetical protein n=1 Tax=Chryseobacterium sp. SORGH_AS_0447 TaxID=3041769 RepID=UPI00278945D6|nr:hypothetical protein [Chryseobacterium sp. SORGH_AS_0447]MDQ1162416.1 hypothetical protein [Chryseobacterium sp. SORGH_AS_0447]
MKKSFLLAAFLGCSISALAQMGISTNATITTLQVDPIKTDGTTSEGIGMPRLTGDQIKNSGSKYGAAQTGAIVYATSIPTAADTKTANITSAGCYYFDGSIWRSMGAVTNTTVISYSTSVDSNILGYVPSKTATASSAPASLTIGSGTYTKQGAATFTVNGHTYAAYSGSAIISWFDAYTAAKNMGGYLATFTTDNEWMYVEQNLLTNNTVFDTQRTWIGFVKFSWDAGAALTPDPEEKWITGEQPLHDYSAGGLSAVRKINWFYTNEPNNSNSGEGFVHAYGKNDNVVLTKNGYTSTHPWNDLPASNVSVNGFIVEFQQ